MNTVIDQAIAKEVAKQLLKIKAVTINTKKPYRYVSGILAPVYTDNRLLISHPEEWTIVMKHMGEVIQKDFKSAEFLSGTATAAIPHAAVLAYTLKLPMVYVRSSKKEHGKENLIEGEFRSGSNVLIVEDLISTAKSIGVNVNAIREAGGKVTHCLAITTSTVSAFIENITSLNIKLVTLTNIQTILKTAISENYISAKEGEIVQRFLNSPKTWGKEMGFE